MYFAAAKWFKTQTCSEVKVVVPADGCHVSLYTVFFPTEKLVFLPSHCQLHAHSNLEGFLYVQGLEYIFVLSDELLKISSLCPLLIHSQQLTYLPFFSKINRFLLPFSLPSSKSEMSGIRAADAVLAAGLSGSRALV